MRTIRLKHGLTFFLCSALLAGCGGHNAATPPVRSASSVKHGKSPAEIAAAPMVLTKKLPPSAMRKAKPDAVFAATGWTQIPGTATQAAAAPDGSLWVLSADPAGSKDKYIWHYDSGAWTNIPGMASQLAPAPDGSLYAINSSGGTYHYSGGSWSSLGGGAAAIAVDNFGEVFVASNDGSYSIWRLSFVNTWIWVGGSGTILAANPDPNTYTVSGGSIDSYGLFVVNASGGIYYTQDPSPYVQLPGAASSIAPVLGGVYVLGYPASANGSALYYFHYNTESWQTVPGSGVSISANTSAMYVVSANGAIYTTQVIQLLSGSPASIGSMGTGTTNMKTIAVSGGEAPYKAGGYDSAIISVTVDPSNSSQLDVIGNQAGSTTITITDAANDSTTVPVTVTTASGTVN